MLFYIKYLFEVKYSEADFMLDNADDQKLRNRKVFHFSTKTFWSLRNNVYLCKRLGGEILSQRCISLLFRT